MLQIENVTRSCVLVDKGKVADNPWTRLKGLIGVRHLPAGDGLMITPCSSVHCMFMSIPIDVLYVSRAHRVVAVDHGLRPWRIGSLHRGVHYVLELPAGTAAATGTAPVTNWCRTTGRELDMTRVVFMGTPDFAAPSLAALLGEGYEVVGVLTRPDQPKGRGQHVEESPVKRLARASGVPVLQPGTLRDEAARADLAALEPELIVVAAFGLIIPQAVLDLPMFGCLNVHGSLLPRHRCVAPIAAAILAGDGKTGTTIMKLDTGLDTGPILRSASLPIAADDTTGTLTPKLAVLGAQLLLETLPAWLRRELTPTPQDEGLATYAPRISKEAGRIDWAQPAAQIERQVRAYQPWPSAYTTWHGQHLKIRRARAGPEQPGWPATPGTIVAGFHDVGVVTGDGALWLLEVQLAGKRVLSMDAFVRGAPGFVGSRLGT